MNEEHKNKMKRLEKTDPDHYPYLGVYLIGGEEVEPWDLPRVLFRDPDYQFYLGNALKYLIRFNSKHDDYESRLVDIEKAITYLQKFRDVFKYVEDQRGLGE